MACLDMYNNSPPSSSSSHHHQHPSPPMSPRISFSNDFVESHNHHSNNSHHLSSSPAPASSDFEFSVSNYNMITADELFFKGRILPNFTFKDSSNNGCNTQMQRTLRDELLLGDDDHDTNNIFSLKPPKSSSSNGWKGFLGLRKSHIGSKKPEKSDPNPKSSQGMVSNEGQSSTDIEMGI